MLNKVILIGGMGQDPELKYTTSGAAVCNLSVATSEVWYDKNTKEKKEQTEWHRVVMFGKQAENVAKYTAKGSKIYVEGKLQTRSWEGSDGVKKYTTEVIARDIKFLSSNKDVNQALGQAEAKKPEYNVASDANFAADDIPF